MKEETARRVCGAVCINGPMPADIGYHSPRPLQEYEEPDKPSQKSCEFLGGAPCWYDGSGANAQGVFDKFVAGGEEALWEEMERWYKMTFQGGAGDE